MSSHTTNTNNSFKELPRWLIRLCRWIWRWQIWIWSIAGIEFLVNYSMQIISAPLQFFAWLITYWWLLLLVVLLEFCTYLVSHYPMKNDIVTLKQANKVLHPLGHLCNTPQVSVAPYQHSRNWHRIHWHSQHSGHCA